MQLRNSELILGDCLFRWEQDPLFGLISWPEWKSVTKSLYCTGLHIQPIDWDGNCKMLDYPCGEVSSQISADDWEFQESETLWSAYCQGTLLTSRYGLKRRTPWSWICEWVYIFVIHFILYFWEFKKIQNGSIFYFF